MAFNKKSVSVSHDILREKQQQVESLERQADDAVELVTRTINRLELINQHIERHTRLRFNRGYGRCTQEDSSQSK